MAQRVVTNLIDDIDDGPADETISFGLDGVDYEIDLSEIHADDLRTALLPFISAARRVGGRARRGTSQARVPSRNNGHSRNEDGHTLVDPSPATVRAWAASNNIAVSDRGRISGHVLAAFRRAQKG